MKLPILKQIPEKADIETTHLAIADLIHRTPIMSCANLDQIAGAQLYFKCENFQKVGAFKMRGAASAALRLTEAQLAKGIATHSSGNHAQAVARAAQYLGVPAYIVMPENAPASKRAATLGYGAKVISCAPTIEARQETLDQVVAETGATFIHPYDDYHVIAGQATAAKELIEDAPALDIIMAPVGGGGLMSGTAISSSFYSPGSRIFGAEPTLVNDAARSFKSGQVEKNTRIDTIADGLRTNLCEKTLSIIRKYLEDILTVEEETIVQAMRLIWERMKIIVEPSCAVPFAAVLTYPEIFAGQKVGIILTGGNVDLDGLPF
jgi:threonine dehydratase